jgi:hydrogenase-1 operon protein HyaF
MSVTSTTAGADVNFPIEVVAKAAPSPGAMALPVLHELQAMLERLIETGEPSSIDLRRTPLSPEDQELLKTLLGRGEVSATVDSLGPTRIAETVISGIWWVTHCNQDGKTVVELIEVSECPELLRSQREDLPAGLERLRSRLAQQRSYIPDPEDIVRSLRALGMSEQQISNNPNLNRSTKGGKGNAE